MGDWSAAPSGGSLWAAADWQLMGSLVGGDGSWIGCRRRLDGRPERPTEASYNAHGHRAPTVCQLAKTITSDRSKQSSLVTAELRTAAVTAHSSRRRKLCSADSYLTMSSKWGFIHVNSCERESSSCLRAPLSNGVALRRRHASSSASRSHSS